MLKKWSRGSSWPRRKDNLGKGEEAQSLRNKERAGLFSASVPALLILSKWREASSSGVQSELSQVDRTQALRGRSPPSDRTSQVFEKSLGPVGYQDPVRAC